MSDFGEGKMIQSRKQHRCVWCGQRIEAGSCYNYRGMYDGEWQNWYMHPECKADYDVSDEPEFMPYDNERPRRDTRSLLEWAYINRSAEGWFCKWCGQQNKHEEGCDLAMALAEAAAQRAPEARYQGPCSACGDGDTAMEFHTHDWEHPAPPVDARLRERIAMAFYKAEKHVPAKDGHCDKCGFIHCEVGHVLAMAQEGVEAALGQKNAAPGRAAKANGE